MHKTNTNHAGDIYGKLQLATLKPPKEQSSITFFHKSLAKANDQNMFLTTISISDQANQ